MTARAYASPQVFKQALEQRLKTASNRGVDFARRRQLLVFDRFLARVVAVFGGRGSTEGRARARAPPGTRSGHQGHRSTADRLARERARKPARGRKARSHGFHDIRSRSRHRASADAKRRHAVRRLPAEPPSRDYYFQYTWILPGIFDSQVDVRRHRYFGAPLKCSARFAFDFWSKARCGVDAVRQRYHELGFVSQSEVRPPLAAYYYVRKPFDTAGFVLIQHGSYQWVTTEDQPDIAAGEVLLYRGIGDSRTFRQLRFEPDDLSRANREVWRTYLALQAEMLSDSVLSFNTIHDRIKRCETAGLRDGTWLADTLAARAGLAIDAPGFAKDLWDSAQQSYTLDPVIAERKFGPRYVVVRTALNNIRITTFFAGESEVRIVDPSRIRDVQPFGCEVQFTRPPEA